MYACAQFSAVENVRFYDQVLSWTLIFTEITFLLQIFNKPIKNKTVFKVISKMFGRFVYNDLKNVWMVIPKKCVQIS